MTNGIGFGSSEYIVFRTTKKIDYEYLFYFLSQESFREAGSHVMTGAVGHRRVPKEYIQEHVITHPSLPEQKRIVKKIDELKKETQQLEALYQKKISALTEFKQSLLQKAFNGELTKDKAA